MELHRRLGQACLSSILLQQFRGFLSTLSRQNPSVLIGSLRWALNSINYLRDLHLHLEIVIRGSLDRHGSTRLHNLHSNLG